MEEDRDGRRDSEAEFCLACASGDAERVRRMLRNEPTLVGAFGKVLPHHEEHMGKFGADDGWTPLHLAAQYGRVEVVKALLEEGANTNALAMNMAGNRPLGSAVVGGNAEVVRLIAEAGADVNAYELGGVAALHLAADGGNHEIIKVLIAAGAKRDLKSRNGRTPADVARNAGDEAGARLIEATS